MSVGAVFAVIQLVAMLAGLAFGAWQLLQGANREATIKRLRGENADYLQRLNYIEPKHRAMEQQVDVLLALHNPTDKLDELSEGIRGTRELLSEDNREILNRLNAVKTLAEQIDRRLYAPRGDRERSDGPG